MEMDERIKHRAYEIWEHEGRPEGRAFEHWMLALSEDAVPNASKSKKAAAPRANAKSRSPRTTPPAAHKTRASEVILN